MCFGKVIQFFEFPDTLAKKNHQKMAEKLSFCNSKINGSRNIHRVCILLTYIDIIKF